MAGRPRSLGAIASEGDRLATLEALRDRIARSIDNPKTLARDLAALSNRMVQILTEIDELKKPKSSTPAADSSAPPVSGLDKFQQKLEEKRRAAAG